VQSFHGQFCLPVFGGGDDTISEDFPFVKRLCTKEMEEGVKLLNIVLFGEWLGLSLES